MNEEQREGCVATVLALALLPLGLLIGGFVVSTLWGWFVVPLGVPDITLWHAAGLSTLVTWFTTLDSKDEGRSPLERLITVWFYTILKFGLVLGIGAILVNHV